MAKFKTTAQAEDAARQGVNGLVGAKGPKVKGAPGIANAIMRSLIQVTSGMLRNSINTDAGSLGGAHSITVVTAGGSELFNAFVVKMLGDNFVSGFATTSWSELIDSLISGSAPDAKALLSSQYALSDEDKQVFESLLSPEMQTYLERSSAARSVLRIQKDDTSRPMPSKEWAILASKVDKVMKNAKTYAQIFEENVSYKPQWETGPKQGLGPVML